MTSSTSTSEAGVPEGSRSNRTWRACDSCYRRKIKCDAVRPQCNWCQHHNIPCTFRRAVRKPRKQKCQLPGESRLRDRIERIEKLLVENLPHSLNQGHENAEISPQSGVGSASPSSTPCFGKLHFAGRRLGDVSSCNGVPLFSSEGLKWVQSRTGQRVSLEKLYSFGIPWQSHRPPQPDFLPRQPPTSVTVELPDANRVREYASLFACSPVRSIFPLIDPILFSETLKRAYGSSDSNRGGGASAKACVCAFFAVAGIFGLGEESAPSIDGETYAWKAQSLLAQTYEASVDGLQTTLMLIIIHLLSGKLQPAIFANTLSAGLTFMLGAHTRTPDYCPQEGASCPSMQQRRERHLRNLFWINYTVDKELALRTRQPPALNDDHCDLTLPPEYGKHCYYETSYDPSPGDAFSYCYFPGDLRLSIIKSQAYSALYSVRALQKNDAELLKAIRETDSELENWRLSIPLKYRPSFSFDNETAPKVSRAETCVEMWSVMLRLEYHHCMATIHQASGRCSAWVSRQSGVMEGVSSSLALSVEASRSSLSYLQTAHHVFAGDSFWLVLFYPMSAVLTLFCNILLNPLETNATGDLELLSKVPALIRKLPIRQLTANEVLHIKHVDDFVSELSRLAKCAITNSGQNGRGH